MKINFNFEMQPEEVREYMRGISSIVTDAIEMADRRYNRNRRSHYNRHYSAVQRRAYEELKTINLRWLSVERLPQDIPSKRFLEGLGNRIETAYIREKDYVIRHNKGSLDSLDKEYYYVMLLINALLK